MKVFPEASKLRKPIEPELTKVQRSTRIAARVLAFVSVFFFFIKILFF